MALSTEQQGLLEQIRALNAEIAERRERAIELKKQYDELTERLNLEHKVGGPEALQRMMAKH